MDMEAQPQNLERITGLNALLMLRSKSLDYTLNDFVVKTTRIVHFLHPAAKLDRRDLLICRASRVWLANNNFLA